jgi:DNA-binding GntR family transcriptional regulator
MTDPSATTPGSIRTNLKDVVADHIRNLIFSGKLRPEQKIDQDELAASLGVSKLPVREALIRLENEALVRGIPRRGVFVAPLTREDVRDHYQIYGMVEGIAARRAAARLDDGQLSQLAALVEQMHSSSEPDRQERLNHEFHRAVNLAGGSPKLLSVLQLLSKTMPARFYEFASGWAEVAADQHHRIMDALAARDEDEAERAMRDHIVSGGEYAIRMLEQSGFWQAESADLATASA